MIKRFLSTLFLWAAAFILPVVFGPQGAVWIIALLTVLTQYELYSLLLKMNLRPQRYLGCSFGALIILGAWYFPQFSSVDSLHAGNDIFTLAVICISLTILNKPDFTETQAKIMPTLLGLLLVPFMLHFYILLLDHFNNLGFPQTGLLLLLWLVAVAKFTDVGGLLLGKVLGRHKLAKEISPGKTWEGAFGGVVIAMLIGFSLSYIFNKYTYMPAAFTPSTAGIIAMPIAVISIASDLVESLLKRKAHVKDSGALIPGIGGAFDLTDSLLLSAPCGFLILKYFIL